MPTKKPTSAIPVEKLLKSLRDASNEGKPEQILSKAKVTSPLLLIGPQQLRVRRLIAWMVEQVFGEDNVSLTTYFGSELSSQNSVKNIASSLTNLSLFSSFEIIVIYDADKIKAAIAKPLAEAISKSQQTLVVLTSASDNKKASLLNAVSKTCTKVTVSELSGAQLKKWIQKEALRLGVTGIEPGAVAMLERCYGDDISSIAGELAKLALLTDAGEPISKALTENTSFRNPEHTSFELLGAIAKKKTVIAVSLTKDLQDQGFHPLQLSAFLSRSFRTMLAHKNHGAVTGELGNAWFARKLSSAKNSYTEEQLEKAIHLLKNLDANLKGSPITPELLIENAVQKLSQSDSLTAKTLN